MASERVVSDQSGYHPTERSWPRDESWKWSQNGVTVAEQVKSGETTTVDPHKEAMPGKRASVCVCVNNQRVNSLVVALRLIL